MAGPFWSVLSLARTERRNGFPSCLGGYVTLTVEEDGQEEQYEAVPPLQRAVPLFQRVE